MDEEKEIEIIISPDRKRIKMGDVRKADEGSITHQMQLVASVMQDKNGMWLEKDKAFEILEEIDYDEFSKVYMRCIKAVASIPLS